MTAEDDEIGTGFGWTNEEIARRKRYGMPKEDKPTEPEAIDEYVNREYAAFQKWRKKVCRGAGDPPSFEP